MFKLLVIAIVTFLLAVPAIGQDAPFEGTWEWIQTEYANGEIVTPASEGYSEQLFFGGDQLFIRFVNEGIDSYDQWQSGEIVVGPCMVETIELVSENWVWWVEGPVRTLKLQVGFECPIGGGTPVVQVTTYVARDAVSEFTFSWGSVKSLFR